MFFDKTKCKFKDLGILVDCSRNAVPKVETLKIFISIMAKMGYTYLELYTEDTYEIKGEPYFGYMRGRYSQSEIKEIDLYCKACNIELVPCIQTLAHLNRITRYSAYSNILDTDEILLADEPATYILIDKMFKALSESFFSRRVNIGMDEAYMLGRGRYLDKNGYKDRMEILFGHLKKVLDIADKYSFKCEMWSDMFMHYVYGNGGQNNKDIPKVISENIPKNVRLINWEYRTAETERFDNVLKLHKKMSDNIGFAGGAWKWTGFAPDNGYTINEIENNIKACIDNNIDSYLLTAWADCGGEASLFSILPSMYFVSLKAYGKDAVKKDNYKEFENITGIKFNDYMLIDKPNKPADKIYEGTNNKSYMFLYNDLLMGLLDNIVSENISEKFKSAQLMLEQIKNKDFGYIFNTLSKLCGVLSIKAEIGRKIKKAYDNKDKEKLKELILDLKELSEKTEAFYTALKYQWHKENKSFGFEVQCARLGALKQRIVYTAERLNNFISGEINNIEELDVKRLDTGWENGIWPIDEDTNCWHNWANIITVNVV